MNSIMRGVSKAVFAVLIFGTAINQVQAREHHRHHYRHGKTEHHAHRARADSDSDSHGQKYFLEGILEAMGFKFKFVSGGAGRGAIPYGDYKIEPGNVGPWGSRHGAIGLADDISDPRYKTPREGIEIHADHAGRTAGCIGIQEGYDKLKKLVIGMIDSGHEVWVRIAPGEYKLISIPAAWKNLKGANTHIGLCEKENKWASINLDLSWNVSK